MTELHHPDLRQPFQDGRRKNRMVDRRKSRDPRRVDGTLERVLARRPFLNATALFINQLHLYIPDACHNEVTRTVLDFVWCISGLVGLRASLGHETLQEHASARKRICLRGGSR